MLTPEQIRSAATPLVAVYRDVEDEVLTMLGKRLAKGSLDNTSQYLADQLASNATTDVAEVLAKATRKIDSTAASTVDSVAGKTVADELKVIGTSLSPTLEAKLARASAVAAQRMVAMTPRIAAGTAQAYNAVVNKAVVSVASGLKSSDRALTDACKELGEKGIQVVDFAKRGTWNVEDVVRAQIRTEAVNAGNDAKMDLYAEADQDLVEVTWHNGARPEHAEWQGQIFSLSGTSDKYPNFYEVTEYGDAAGLCGVNCRHDYGAYDEELGKRYPEPIDIEENNRVYALEQEQRKQEREIRKLKRQRAVLDGAGIDAPNINAKIAQRQAKIRSIVDEGGLRRRYDRENPKL